MVLQNPNKNNNQKLMTKYNGFEQVNVILMTK